MVSGKYSTYLIQEERLTANKSKSTSWIFKLPQRHRITENRFTGFRASVPLWQLFFAKGKTYVVKIKSPS
jgi:hypothetical protein